MPVRILIVENNIAVAQDLASRLTRFGYEVAGIFTSGDEVMQGIDTVGPDLIIMNIRLQKETDGIQTGRLVRAKYDIPLIYMTEFAGQTTIRQSKSTGPFGYIFIPFIDKQIFTTLEIALLRNQYEKEIQRQVERAKTLVKSAEQLNSNLDFRVVLDTICKLIHSTLKASSTYVFLINHKKDGYHQVAVTQEISFSKKRTGAETKIPTTFVDSILTNQKQVALIHNTQRLRDVPYEEFFQDENIQSIAVAGIVHQKEALGVIFSVFTDYPSSLQKADIELLKGLADQAAVAITNASLFKQVQIGREYQRKLAKSIVDIQEEERRHLARELHDHLGQILTGMQFMLENTKKQSGEKQLASIEEIQKTVSEVIGQVREMSLNLRPSMLDDMGLVPTLQWHLERFEVQTGIHVNFEDGAFNKRLPSEVETTAYRIIQEALTNVARHAQVKEVFVGLVIQDETLWIEILDQGEGFDPSTVATKPTSGLSGMRERASLAGGYIVIESFIDQGTQIVTALPLTGKPLERRKYDRNNRRPGR